MSGRPKLLDLFCCEGGAAVGYDRAGFDVYGVDIDPKVAKRYPYPIHVGDALDVMRRLLDGEAIDFQHQDGTVEWLTLTDLQAIHASPPCQSFLNLGAVNRALGRAYDYPNLIGPTRELIATIGKPYVIENVEGAKAHLSQPVRVCGTGMGRPLRRHRLFESSSPLVGVDCAHGRFTERRYWTGWRPGGEIRLSTVVQVYGNAGGQHEWADAMGINWMDRHGFVEAIPPAYSEFIGSQLLASLSGEVTA